MAKVKITGHASGSGVFTITAPNSNTDRTITLPDASVTLGTDATKLPLAGGTMTGNLVVSGTNAAINITAGGTSEDSVLNFVQGSTIEGGITYDHNGTYGSENIKFRAGNNTEQLKIMGNGRGVSQFTAKAWINMSDSATRDSHNISHTSDNGTGDFSCYFDADMANTNYVPLTGQEGGFDVCRFNTHHTSYVGEYRFQTGYQASNGALTKADTGYQYYAFFGD